MPNLNNVQRFYKDKVIFITGGAGFMGKVLVEKLLYSCSDLKSILLLMRPKRGKTAEERIEMMQTLPLFHRIRDEKPEMFRKIIPVFGDITSINLGLSNEHLQLVLNETNVLFHMAATLKLEGTLKPAVEMNLTGTQHVIDLAKKMPKLNSIVHLSTAFCNCDQKVMYEEVYDCHHNPKDLIQMSQWMDENVMADLGNVMIAPQPNTYTYTKRLAEILVRDEFPNLPICIARPSIVTPSFKEPLAGWVDSLNGPIGVIVAGAKGAIRSMYGNGSYKTEIIPVDMAINGLICIAYFNGTFREKPKTIPVYNVTCDEKSKGTWDGFIESGRKINLKYPFEVGIWYPNGRMTTNKYYHKLNVFLFQWIPAYLVDFLMFCFMQKRFMVRLQNKISVGLDVLQFFTSTEWEFKSENFKAINRALTPDEREMFLMDSLKIVDENEYLKNTLLGGRVYCMKEPLSTLPKARRHMKILYWMDKFFKTLFFMFVIWQFLKMMGFWS